MKKINKWHLTLTAILTATAHLACAITFETSNLYNTSETNYIEFINESNNNINFFNITNHHNKHVADFDGDGLDDILTLGNPIVGITLAPFISLGRPELLLQKENEFIYHNIRNTFNYFSSNEIVAQVLDIDNDSDLDILLAGGDIAINDGSANFRLIKTGIDVTIPFSGEVLFATDWDNDGDQDLVTNKTTFINTGDFNFLAVENNISEGKFIIVDLNHDGIGDVLSANDNTLQSWINNGNNQLTLAGELNVQFVDSIKLKALDVDGDGNSDKIIFANLEEVKLLTITSQGTLTIDSIDFSEINNIEHSANQTIDITIKDADGDGDNDIWVSTSFGSVNCEYHQSQVLLYNNKGDGDFKYQHTIHSIGKNLYSQQTISTPTIPLIIDLNNDKLTDVVMVADRPMTWLQNSNANMFRPSQVSILQYNQGLDVADFDLDGNMDIINTSKASETCNNVPDTIDISSDTKPLAGYIWLGDGTGNFSPFLPSISGISIYNSSEIIKFADLENQGYQGVIKTFKNDSEELVSTYSHPTSNDPPFIIRFSTPSLTIETAEMFEGQEQEIVMIAATDDAPIMVLKYAYPHFEEVVSLDFGFRNGEIKLADMDNDGKIDIVSNNKEETQAITIWYNNGDRTFSPSIGFSGNVKTIGVADFNNDGLVDIFSSNPQQEIWLNQGNRAFTMAQYDTDMWVQRSSPDDNREKILHPEKIEFSDINNDGHTDFIVQDEFHSYAYINDSTNENISFYQTQNFYHGKNNVVNTAFADFNKDGKQDLVIGTNSGIEINIQKQEPNLSGLYYDKKHSGHGFSLANLGFKNLYYSIFYTYDDDGKPQWYASLNRFQTGKYSYKLKTLGKNETIHYSYDYITGTATQDQTQEHLGYLNFLKGKSDNRFETTFRISNQANNWYLQNIIAKESQPENDFSGIWWAGQEDSGWGISLDFIQQENSQYVVAILYFYDENGQPRWLIGQQGNFVNNQEVSINMEQVNGYGRQQNQVELSRVPAGTITINLKHPSNDLQQAGTLSMDVKYPEDADNDNWKRDNIPFALFSKPRE